VPVDMVDAVLRVHLDDEDRAALPVHAVGDGVHDAPDRLVVVGRGPPGQAVGLVRCREVAMEHRGAVLVRARQAPQVRRPPGMCRSAFGWGAPARSSVTGASGWPNCRATGRR
jgi:hypothetical protein